MEIKMSGATFNHVMNVCIPATSSENNRRVLGFIQLVFADGNGIATALNGFALAQCQFAYCGDNGEMLIPKHKTVRNDAEITISNQDGKISVSDGMETVITDAYDDTFFDWQKVIAERYKHGKTIGIGIDKVLLINALKSYKERALVFEIAGELDAIVIRGYDAHGIVLPLRITDKDNRFETFYGFTYPEKQEGGVTFG